MSTKDDMDILVHLRGVPQFVSDGKDVTRTIRGTGDEAERTGRKLGVMNAAGTASRRVFDGVRTGARMSAYALGATATATAIAVARMGTQYNQLQDSQEVAFTTLLGSQGKAMRFMEQLEDLADRSPVLDPAATGEAARTLMAYGVAVKDILPFVEALGDMSASSGKSIQETMPLAAMAIGQIVSKDKLQAEELNQLAESIGLSRGRIRKALGMSRKDFEDAFTPGNSISADRALPAILKAMEEQSDGAADRAAEKTEGRVDRMQEKFAKFSGIVTRPFYDEFGRLAADIAEDLDAIIPDAERVSNRIGGIWRSEKIDVGDKLRFSGRALSEELGPEFQEFIAGAEAQLGDLELGELIAKGLDTALPVILEGAADAAGEAVETFATAWWEADLAGKLFVGSLILAKLGVFTAVGGAASNAFMMAMLARKLQRMGAFVTAGMQAGAAYGRGFSTAAAPAVATGMATGVSTRQGQINTTMATAGAASGRTMGNAAGRQAAASTSTALTGAAREGRFASAGRALGMALGPVAAAFAVATMMPELERLIEEAKASGGAEGLLGRIGGATFDFATGGAPGLVKGLYDDARGEYDSERARRDRQANTPTPASPSTQTGRLTPEGPAALPTRAYRPAAAAAWAPGPLSVNTGKPAGQERGLEDGGRPIELVLKVGRTELARELADEVEARLRRK